MPLHDLRSIYICDDLGNYWCVCSIDYPCLHLQIHEACDECNVFHIFVHFFLSIISHAFIFTNWCDSNVVFLRGMDHIFLHLLTTSAGGSDDEELQVLINVSVRGSYWMNLYSLRLQAFFIFFCICYCSQLVLPSSCRNLNSCQRNWPLN